MTSENNKLSKFTDFFNDDLPNSQPISLPSSSDSHQFLENNVESERIRPPKGYGQQGEFRCVNEVDSKYRAVFTYPYFNLVQSKLIDDALYSAKSMVVCAPTGSGKTVVFEMAIVQLLTEIEEMNYTEDYKIIYMAPVKALCSERLAEWYPKFTRLGLLCIEVTGDTDVDFPQLKPYKIIITTPEKWDMLTRRWKAHRELVEMIKLFLIDEVHILNDETRGPVLEAVVSRMKTVEASAQSSHRIEHLQRQREGLTSPNTPPPRIRFVAVSATVSNPDDVATWLGTRDRPAVFYKFGDECRPVRLRRVVEGYPCPAGASIFKFDIILNYKIWPLIQRYHNGKPTLIFCNTRKSVLLTAETLSKEITVSFSQEQKTKLMEIASTIKTKKIQSLILSGIGCHHAGLLYEERQTIEDAFRDRKLPILITTTTLAMGVNLPAHLVIIKNTQQYVNGTYQEYSISTILQMVGRAGRPQYDTEATAVIMTRLADKARYEALVGGCEPLQSYLHKRIAENLNSEAALSTVCDVAQCVQWLNSTFFCVRAARDPKRYLGLPATAPAHQISKKIEELCVKAMNGLASAGLITMDEASCIESTEAGRLMSVYYLDLETMKLIMKIDGSETLEQLLWLVCESHELSEMHLRVDERRNLNLLNRNKAAPTIRFPMKGKISTRQMKSNCVIQAILGCLPILDPSLNQEATKIIRIAERVCKCLVAYMTRPDTQKSRYFSAVLNSLVLCKCVCAHLWENSPYVSKQLRGIGPALSGLLATAGKVSFTIIEESHPRDLERIINKAPPAGNLLRKQVSLLPKYAFKLILLDPNTVRVQLMMLNAAFLAENLDHLTAGADHKCYIIVGDSENYILHFSSFKDSDLVSLYDGCITFEVTRLHNHEHKIMAHCISSNFVGLDERCEYIFASVLPAIRNDFEINALKENYRETKEHEGIIAKNNKRRITIDVGQCNEKKKRGNNFIESLQNLKKSVINSTQDFKTEFNKSKDLTNSVLQDILEPGQDICDDNELSLIMCNPENDIVLTNSSYNIDDKEIGSILNNIENEIHKNHSENNGVLQNQNKNFERIQQNVKVESPKNRVTCPFNRKPPLKYKRILNTKNNFSFLDTTEKRDEEQTKKPEGGLPDFVKEQILQFLGKAKNESIKKYFAADILTPEDNKVKDRPRSSAQKDSVEKGSFSVPLQKSNGDILLDTTKKIHFEDEDKNSNKFTIEDEVANCKNIVMTVDDQLNLNGEEMNKNITDTANETTESNMAQDLLHTAVNKEMTNNTKLVSYFDHDAKISSDLVNITDTNFLTANYENSNNIATFNDIQRPKCLTNLKNMSSNCESNNSVAIVSTKQNIILNEVAKHFYDSEPHTTNENCHKMAKVNDVQLPGKNTDFEEIPSICESYNMSKLDTRHITYLNFGPHSNRNIDANKIGFDGDLKDHRNEKKYFKKQTEEEGYVNKFSYSASNINLLLTEKDSQIRIVNKLEIDLKVTQIICKKSSSKDKLNENKENLKPSNESIKDDICTELEPINKNVKYDLIGAREVKQNILNYTLNSDMEADKNAKTTSVPIAQCVDNNNTNKEEKCPFKNIIEKYKTKTRGDAHQRSLNLPKQNKTITPVLARQVKSQKQYRIKDINKTDDITMKNISQIFREGKHDVKELPTAIPSLPIIDSEYTKSKPKLDAITNSNSTKLKPDSDTRPLYQNFTDTKNSITKNHINVEDSVIDGIQYTIFKTDPNSPLEPEDVISVLSESENEEINLSMLNPKTLLQTLTNDALEVIPPPMEFRDDAYSPVTSNNPIKSDINSYTPNSSPHNEIDFLEPTACNVETWSLSQESDDYDNFEHKFTPLNSFSMFGNQNIYSPCSDLNLSQFKYKGKPKLRK